MADDNDFGFALPAFDAGNALVQLKRALRDLKLAERGNGFELKGKTVLQLALDEGAVAVRLARRLATTPEWDRQIVKSGADQRKLIDEVKRRLERWQRED
jgi:hypothetical protein